MTKKKNKALALALAACLSFGTLGAFGGIKAHDAYTASALSTSSTVTYPFATGADAFKYAPTLNATDTTSKDYWEYAEVLFDNATVDFTGVEYVAIQVKMEKGNPGLTIGFIENADRYFIAAGNDNAAEADRNPVYFQSESGSIRRIAIQYNAISLGADACGTLYLPMSSMVWQWNNSNSNLTKVKSLYYTANLLYNRDYAFTIGEIGLYKGEPGTATMEKIVDLSKGERAKSKYYAGSAGVSFAFPGDKAMPKIPYAFAEGEDAFKNTQEWKPTVANQTLTVNFDEDTVDLSEATHLLVQYYSAQSPRLQYTLTDGTKSSSLKNGARVFFMAEGANYSDLYVTANGSGASFGENKGRLLMGMIVIPIEESMSANANLSAITSLVIKAAGATDVVIGGIASYKGERGDGSYEGGETTTLLSLATSKSEKFTASAEDTLTEIQAKPVYNSMFGDSETVTQDLTFAKTQRDYTGEWSGTQTQAEANRVFIGGSYGKIEMTKMSEDSEDDDALKVTATGVFADGYTATQNLLNGGVSWAGMKGVAFWARNDSDIEVAFNLEVECTAVVTKANGNKQVASDRFNIQQGNRFTLYNTKTGKTTIYMTRPTATLPVGFEGWVFIPFTAFARASWSNNGVTSEQFMGENTYVNFLAFTIEAAKNQNKPFSIGNIGAYSVTPSFESSYVKAEGKTVPELLGLIKEEN